MNINISKLNELEEISISELFLYEDLGTTNIKKADNILFDGILYFDYEDNIIIEGNITGFIILEDSIDLSDYKYQLDIKIEELVEVTNYIIDIKEIVWKNIILELPMKITSKKLKEEKGENWEIKSE